MDQWAKSPISKWLFSNIKTNRDELDTIFGIPMEEEVGAIACAMAKRMGAFEVYDALIKIEIPILDEDGAEEWAAPFTEEDE